MILLMITCYVIASSKEMSVSTNKAYNKIMMLLCYILPSVVYSLYYAANMILLLKLLCEPADN